MMRPDPAHIVSRSMDRLAWNPADSLCTPGWPTGRQAAHLARCLFLPPPLGSCSPAGAPSSEAVSPACGPKPESIPPPDLTNLVGELTLSGQSVNLEGTPGRRPGAGTAEPGSPDHDAMLLLDMTGPRSITYPDTKTGPSRRTHP